MNRHPICITPRKPVRVSFRLPPSCPHIYADSWLQYARLWLSYHGKPPNWITFLHFIVQPFSKPIRLEMNYLIKAYYSTWNDERCLVPFLLPMVSHNNFAYYITWFFFLLGSQWVLIKKTMPQFYLWSSLSEVMCLNMGCDTKATLFLATFEDV